MPLPFPIVKFLARTKLACLFPRVRRRVGATGRVLHHLSDRMLGTPLWEIDDLQHEIDGFDSSCIDLASPPTVMPLYPGRATSRMDSSVPIAGLSPVRRQLSERIAQQSSLQYRFEDEIIVTHGGHGALQLIADAFINTGDRVVLFDPTSPMFVEGFRRRRAVIRWLPCRCDTGEPKFDGEQLRRAMAGAKMLCLCHPGNPLGNRLSVTELADIVAWATKYDVAVVWDRSFAQSKDDSPEFGELLATLKPRLFVIDRCGAAGVGWLAADASLARACMLAAHATHAPVPAVAQLQASALLANHDEPPISDWLRDYAIARLSACGLEPITPQSGPFIWASVNRFGISGRAFSRRLARDHGVILAPGDRCGPSGESFVRVTYAADDGRLREGLHRLSNYVHNIFPDRPEIIEDDASPTVAARLENRFAA